MPTSALFIEFERFSTFGDLLKYLRRRAGLTQRELSIAVGYSISQISRLELNLRLPDLATIAARFVPALDLEEEADIARRLMELAAAMRSEDAPASGAPPYKGLNYFDEADADLYFGREALVAKLASRVLGQRPGERGSSDDSSSSQPPGSPAPSPFLAVVGASGSGKSSVVRAGLVHALRWNSPSANWPVHLLTPTTHPLEALAVSLTPDYDSTIATATLMDDLNRDPRALHLWARRLLSPEVGASASRTRRGEPSPSRLGDASPTRLVLVVDQFEELFTLCQEDGERTAFVDNLLTAAFEPDGPICLVITLRADFYAYCAPYAALRSALAEHQEYIGPMSADELRQAIEEPARRGGWELEDGLADVILHDLGAEGSRSPEPGALPLLSHALLETWHRRRGRTLTLSGYLASGGVRGAIAETAETLFRDQLDADQQAIARNIFLRLTAPGDDEEVIWTRRRVAFDELIATQAEAIIVREVLTCLADARLITTSEAAAEVAHEALLREWPRLNDWLINNRVNIRLQRQLTNAVAEWRRAHNDPGFLLTGARLAQFESLASQNALTLAQDERAYLEASLAERDRQALEERERQRRELEAAQKLAETERARSEEQMQYVARLRTRNRAITGVGALALLAAVIAAMLGGSANRAAQSNATLAAQNAVIAKTAQAEASIRATAQVAAEAQRRLATSRELASAALSNLDVDPERGLLLALRALSVTYTAEAEDALHTAVQAARIQFVLPGQTFMLAYSPDGRRLAVSSTGDLIRLIDTTTGQETSELPGHFEDVGSLAFSPDGTRLAVGSGDGTARVWDTRTSQSLLSIRGQSNCICAMAFSPDGRRLATGSYDFSVRVWDIVTGQLLVNLTDHTNLVSAVNFSPDGKRLVTASWDHTVKVREADTGKVLLDLTDDAGFFAAYSPDGKRLAIQNATASAVKLLDAETGQIQLSLELGVPFDLAFSADGNQLVTAGPANTLRVWDALSGRELRTVYGPSRLHFLGLSRDGKHAAAIDEANIGRIWDISPEGSREWLTLAPQAGPLHAVAYSPDGTRLAAAAEDGTARVFDAVTGNQLLVLAGHTERVNDLDFSPDGKRLATASFDNTVKVWDTTTGRQLLSLEGHGKGVFGGVLHGVLGVAFRPDGQQLASAGADGNAIIWDANTGRSLLTLSNHGLGLYSLAFSPTEWQTRLLTASQFDPADPAAKATAQMWDISTGQQLFGVTQATYIFGLAFSPDGTRFVTAGFGGVAVWDAHSGQEVLTLPGLTGLAGDAAFSADGSRLATASTDRTVQVWDAHTGQLLLTLAGNTQAVKAVVFSRDGRHLVTIGDDGMIRIDLLRLDDLVALAQLRVTRTLTSEECQKYLHVAQCPQP